MRADDGDEPTPASDDPSDARPARVPARVITARSPPTAPAPTAPGHGISGLDWCAPGADARPILLLLHPNGFCAGVFDPIVQELADRYHCIGVDVLGHGGTDAPDPATFELADGALEVVAMLDALGIHRVACVGHSLGGIVATLVDRARPGLIDRLVLCEPVIFPAGFVRDPGEGPTIAELTRRRRSIWPDRAEMAARFGSRPPLDALAPAALASYLHHGVHDRPDGTVELACPPEIEATIFDITPTGRGAAPAWEHLTHLTARTVVVSGDRTTLPGIFAEQAARIGCPHVVTTGGHLFLHEDPPASALLIAGLLDELTAAAR